VLTSSKDPGRPQPSAAGGTSETGVANGTAKTSKCRHNWEVQRDPTGEPISRTCTRCGKCGRIPPLALRCTCHAFAWGDDRFKAHLFNDALTCHCGQTWESQRRYPTNCGTPLTQAQKSTTEQARRQLND